MNITRKEETSTESSNKFLVLQAEPKPKKLRLTRSCNKLNVHKSSEISSSPPQSSSKISAMNIILDEITSTKETQEFEDKQSEFLKNEKLSEPDVSNHSNIISNILPHVSTINNDLTIRNESALVEEDLTKKLIMKYVTTSLIPGTLIFAFGPGESFWPAIISSTGTSYYFVPSIGTSDDVFIHVSYLYSYRPSRWIKHKYILLHTLNDPVSEMILYMNQGLHYYDKKIIIALLQHNTSDKRYLKAFTIIQTLALTTHRLQRIDNHNQLTVNTWTGVIMSN